MNTEKIYRMIDWNMPRSIQNQGIQMAETMDVDPFVLPLTSKYNKNIWHNCSIIVSKRDDETLRPYLYRLMQWVEDLNWPGALKVLRRLKQYESDLSFELSIMKCRREALRDNPIWDETLYSLSLAKMDLMDYPMIMRLLQSNLSAEQEQGRILASRIESIDVFFQPLFGDVGAETWENCSLIVSKRDDRELEKYLYDLFSWIKSLDTPGAKIINQRLRRFNKNEAFRLIQLDCIRQAKREDDDIWLHNLQDIM